MMNIAEFLENVYQDLRKSVDGNGYLCKLKNLKFNAGCVPDYEDVNIQQVYLLRYAFAYAFEYSQMYLDVLSQMDNPEQISVTSIGCGSMVDYASLVYALEKRREKSCKIRYTGIDKVDWHYKFPERDGENRRFLKGDAKKYFAENPEFVSDVYIFPKSISEFSEAEIGGLAANFSTKPIRKDKFFVCISLRDNEGSMERDLRKTKQIIEAVNKNGFTTRWPYSQYKYYPENKGITSCDSSFRYPQEILDFVTQLSRKCLNYQTEGANCQPACSGYLDRSPILKTGHIRYQVIMFERRK